MKYNENYDVLNYLGYLVNYAEILMNVIDFICLVCMLEMYVATIKYTVQRLCCHHSVREFQQVNSIQRDFQFQGFSHPGFHLFRKTKEKEIKSVSG